MARKKKYKFEGTGLTDAEKKWGKRRFSEYKKNYSIERISDLQLLDDLVYREVIDRRMKLRIKELDDANETITDKNGKKKKPVVPKSLRQALDENLDKQLILKERLGFFQDRENNDFYKYLKIQEKKFDIYRKEHPMEFETSCPFCGEIFFLYRRTKNFKPSKLKLYKNKILLNEEMWKDYKKGKLEKDKYARYLNVSPSFIDWLDKHIKD